MAKGYKAEDIKDSEMLFVVGHWKLLAQRIADKPRRIAILDIIFTWPGSDDDVIRELYVKKCGEDIAMSTLNSDLRMLVKHGLCETMRSGHKKLYRLSDFLTGYMQLVSGLETGIRFHLPFMIAREMRG